MHFFYNKNLILHGKKIFLRSLQLEDVTEKYVSWLNDLRVNQFLESRFIHHTLKSTQTYVSGKINNPNIIFLAVIDSNTNIHIGNIKSEVIDWKRHTCDIGFMIGEPSVWGRGFAVEAVKLLVDYVGTTLHITKITAGVYKNNIGSIKVLQKSGFREVGRRKIMRGGEKKIIEVLRFEKNMDSKK